MPTHYKGTLQEVRALNAFIKFTRAAESLESRLTHAGSLGNLTLTQFSVLEALFHLGPMCQRAIGGKLLKSGGNITLVIDNLEKQGLVRRDRDLEDRRMATVSLTPQGEHLISEVFPQHVKAIVNEFDALTPDEQETLGALCRKLGRRDLEKEADCE